VSYRPPRALDPLSPSARKNLELFEAAGQGRGAAGMARDKRFHGRQCGECVNWAACLPELGAGQEKMNYCARPSRGWKPVSAPRGAEGRV
jgi:hypothetical protein